MKKIAAVILGSFMLVGGANAMGRDLLARFEGGIGVIPAQSGVGPANADGTFPNVRPNVVRGVAPAPGPWRITDLGAEILSDGRIQVRGRGLLLAAGNSIGQNGNQSVFATLICEPSLPFTERNTDTAGVRLQPNGDFRIDDQLSSVPSECASPVLLIRSASGAWLAAGIPDLGNK